MLCCGVAYHFERLVLHLRFFRQPKVAHFVSSEEAGDLLRSVFVCLDEICENDEMPSLPPRDDPTEESALDAELPAGIKKWNTKYFSF